MTIDPKDLKEGDRVEITVRGAVISLEPDGRAFVRFDGGSISTGLLRAELAQAKITLLEPELKEGRAEELGRHPLENQRRRLGHVLHVHAEHAWFKPDDQDIPGYVIAASNLRNIKDPDHG